MKVFGTEFLYYMPSAKAKELSKALALYDLQAKRQTAETEVPAADLTEEMQLSAPPVPHQAATRMSAIPERVAGGGNDDDDEEEQMVVHRSARKPLRSRLYRDSDEHSVSTPAHQPIPRHSVNSAATVEDSPSPDKGFGRHSNFYRPRRTHTGSTDSTLESNDDASDDEVNEITEGMTFTVSVLFFVVRLCVSGRLYPAVA